jgi:hypothetical protein
VAATEHGKHFGDCCCLQSIDAVTKLFVTAVGLLALRQDHPIHVAAMTSCSSVAYPAVLRGCQQAGWASPQSAATSPLLQCL